MGRAALQPPEPGSSQSKILGGSWDLVSKDLSRL